MLELPAQFIGRRAYRRLSVLEPVTAGFRSVPESMNVLNW